MWKHGHILQMLLDLPSTYFFSRCFVSNNVCLNPKVGKIIMQDQDDQRKVSVLEPTNKKLCSAVSSGPGY